MTLFTAKSESELKEIFAEIDPDFASDCMRLMFAAHDLYNKKFFRNRLNDAVMRPEKIPKKDADVNEAAGAWAPRTRSLYISPEVFTFSFAYFRTLMLHEMCHQAQTDIDKLDFKFDPDGHGEEWIKWMKHCGLAPAVTGISYSVIPEGVSKKVRADFMRSINKLNKTTTSVTHPNQMKFGQMYTFFDTDDGMEGKLLQAMYVGTKYHPETHENMVVMTGDYHEPKGFDYHWPDTSMWTSGTSAPTNLKKRGIAIIKKLGM